MLEGMWLTVKTVSDANDSHRSLQEVSGKTSIDYLGYKISSGTCTPHVRNIYVINAIKLPTKIAPAWTDRGQRSAWAETTERHVTFFFWSVGRIPLLEAEGKVEFPCQTERRLKAILQAASCGRKDVKLSCKQCLVEGKTSSYPASSVLWKERRKLSCKQRLVDGENALEYPSSSNLRAEKTLRQPTSRDNWTSHKTSQAKPSLRRCCHEVLCKQTLDTPLCHLFLSPFPSLRLL
ncbi:hypothetical protein LAZ67_8001563 [Cordylochernes scorpioides]|uniref:Uncharacterized protein n=1 Tax=Cordylochernes scorpioides TaxID=51811 RepID=A0ABY6KQD4_9ARAC|nr:hypothetical protein LAZ67_8001563 [Cordylochernes scorpioides]